MTKNSTYILGISAFYHDSSACIIKDGKVIAAAQEEWFTRKKHDENFPINAVKYCLEEAKIPVEDIDFIAYYEKPILKFERLLQTYIKNWPRGFFSFAKAMRSWLGKKLWIESEIKKELRQCCKNCDNPLSKKKLENLKLLYVPHHLSHAAASFYNSGFEKSAILVLDGVGEWSTTTMGIGEKNNLILDQEIIFPHSIGLFYSAFTYYLGFKVNSGEYKVMGLAPYGTPKYADKIYELLEIFEDGSFRLRPEFFAYEYDLKMISPKFERHFGFPARGSKDPLTDWHKDLAASLQRVVEDLILKLVEVVYQKYDTKNLCLAGGVALNCVANGRILRESKFENLYIFPASGDAGGAVGAAQYAYALMINEELRMKNGGKNFNKQNSIIKHFSLNIKHYKISPLSTIYLGPSAKPTEIEKFLQQYCIKSCKLDDKRVLWKTIATLLQENKVIGVFHNKMEFGPRALGNRSIIADPRRQENWQRVNLKIKFRESFRPFAPSVLKERADEIFDLRGVESPYMLLTAQTKVDFLPATTHLDGSARIQTVSETQNENFYGIITEFEKLTGCPAVINTSFNVRGEPIVCHFEDAFKCFLSTDLDILVLDHWVIKSEDIDKNALKKQFSFENFEED